MPFVEAHTRRPTLDLVHAMSGNRAHICSWPCRCISFPSQPAHLERLCAYGLPETLKKHLRDVFPWQFLRAKGFNKGVFLLSVRCSRGLFGGILRPVTVGLWRYVSIWKLFGLSGLFSMNFAAPFMVLAIIWSCLGRLAGTGRVRTGKKVKVCFQNIQFNLREITIHSKGRPGVTIVT